MTNFVIEKNIPVPTRTRLCKMPFDMLNVNESFLVSCSGSTAHSATCFANKTGSGKKFVCRKVGDKSYRIWRTQ